MNTRPPSSDPADIAAWEEEKARLREEREFRDDVRTFIGKQGAEMTGVREDMTALRGEMQMHAQDDRKQFEELKNKQGGVRSSIVKTDKRLAWLAGLGVGMSAVLGLALWLLEHK